MPLPVGESSRVEDHSIPISHFVPTEMLYDHSGLPVVGSVAIPIVILVTPPPPPPPPPAPRSYGPEIIDVFRPCLVSWSISEVKYQYDFLANSLFTSKYSPFALFFIASFINGRAVFEFNLLSNSV